MLIFTLFGCNSSNQLLDENTQLKEELTRAKSQLSEENDKAEAIVQFAKGGLVAQAQFKADIGEYLDWWSNNIPDDFPKYTDSNQYRTATVLTSKLMFKVSVTTNVIEQFYAPKEVIELKKQLLSEGDSIYEALRNINTYYVNYGGLPTSYFTESYNFITKDVDILHTNIRRSLTDLVLEYER